MTRAPFSVSSLGPAAQAQVRAQLQNEIGKAAKRSKYGNRKAAIDAIVFDSEHEAKRYLVLKAEMHAGKIHDLAVHPAYDLIVNETFICRYIADFEYIRDGKRVVEDAKGVRRPEYILKRKLMKACRGIIVVEV